VAVEIVFWVRKGLLPTLWLCNCLRANILSSCAGALALVFLVGIGPWPIEPARD
jgi:hypothetical protein